MKSVPPLVRWLALAALGDWLIMRTLTRSAIFMPKSPPVLAAYDVLTVVGQFCVTLSSLLALLTAGWIAWRGVQADRSLGLPLLLAGIVLLGVVFVIVPPTGGLALTYHVLLIAALAWLGGALWRVGQTHLQKAAGVLPVAAVLIGEIFQATPNFYEALRLPGPSPFTSALFNLGEALVVGSALVWWLAYGRGAPRRAWILAALPAVAFLRMHLADPAMTGTIAIWSTGLSLYLPWPLYVAALWLAGVAVQAALRQGNPAGWAILLLIAGGYAPQLSTQMLISLAGLWLLAQPALKPIHTGSPYVADPGLAPESSRVSVA